MGYGSSRDNIHNNNSNKIIDTIIIVINSRDNRHNNNSNKLIIM